MRNIRRGYWAVRRYTKNMMRAAPPDPPANEVLAGLQEPIASALLSAYEGCPQIGLDGNSYELDKSTRISAEQGMWIYELCRRVRPERTLEIGLAYGFSTLFFFAAHQENGSGRHTAIDPLQCSSDFHGIGLQRARQFGMEESFRWIQEMSVVAVPALYKEGLRFEVIFIDGDHRFDSVLADFTLCDLICSDGGYVIFDDMWMPSIQKAVAFIDHNRPDYIKEKTPVSNISVYRKLGPDKRDWRHFVDF
jgi:predicted O-methyltransferase YrrM